MRTAVRFGVNNEMYKQHDVIAMGSPLGLTLSNISIHFLGSKTNLKLNNEIQLLWCVDDFFVLTKNEKHSNDFFNLHSISF